MLKHHFYLLKNTQNPAQLYICSKHKEFAVNFFFKLWVYIFLNSKKFNDLVIFKTLKIQGIYLVFRAKFLEYFRSKNLISMISMIRIHDHMLPRDSPSAPPPISGGSTLKSQNKLPPVLPPPFPGGAPWILKILAPPGVPPVWVLLPPPLWGGGNRGGLLPPVIFCSPRYRGEHRVTPPHYGGGGPGNPSCMYIQSLRNDWSSEWPSSYLVFRIRFFE